MKMKYRHMTFKKDTAVAYIAYEGWSKRTSSRTTFIHHNGTPIWVGSHHTPLTAAEHREIADFLDKLNSSPRDKRGQLK